MIGIWQMIIVLALLVGLVVAIFYLLNLQQVLKEVHSSRRLVPDSNVWLMLIPLFNIVYGFILYPKICDSVKAEYEARGAHKPGDYGRSIGVTMPSLTVARIVIGFVIPIFSSLIGIANLVLMISFWVKMSGYKKELQTLPSDGEFSIGNNPDLLDS